MLQQQSVVPELAHDHTRPIHWVATATAVAGVVALTSLLQPHPATAAQSPGADPVSAPTSAPPPATTGVDFPLDCGPVTAVVQRRASGDLDGDGRPETVATVHCDAGMGTPPDALYVLVQAAGDQHARVVATLVEPKDRSNVSSLTITDAAIHATVLGYSSPEIPSCCPDVTESVKWQWKNGAFIRSTSAGAPGN
ncbi:hypothetical protein [Streptomyces sp. NPDC059378]|uniref:hypothetical protein n=1 Tax=Streptomyces sp. NPDC059378 TaxID=3346815 RepID=UPI0036BF06E2